MNDEKSEEDFKVLSEAIKGLDYAIKSVFGKVAYRTLTGEDWDVLLDPVHEAIRKTRRNVEFKLGREMTVMAQESSMNLYRTVLAAVSSKGVEGDTSSGNRCDECGALIPVLNGGSSVNKHHSESCSLYDPKFD